ncbi:MAG: hypothetical protein IT376_10790 [Polyangiaceae bacterium]|nr:hypothetical protein [Polyangiaceae bacterium]
MSIALGGAQVVACASKDPAGAATGSLGDAAAADGASDGGSTRCPTGPGPVGDDEWPPDMVPVDGGVPGWTFEARGEVVAASPGRFTLDRCAPGAACALAPVTIGWRGGGLPSALPLGAFVDVNLARVSVGPMSGVSLDLTVRSVPSWEGTPNPVTSWDGWYLVLRHALEVPCSLEQFDVSAIPSSCGDPATHGRHYSLRFSDDSSHVDLEAGDVATSTLGGQEWRITVVRAQDQPPGQSDYTPPFSWWAEGIAP